MRHLSDCLASETCGCSSRRTSQRLLSHNYFSDSFDLMTWQTKNRSGRKKRATSLALFGWTNEEEKNAIIIRINYELLMFAFIWSAAWEGWNGENKMHGKQCDAVSSLVQITQKINITQFAYIARHHHLMRCRFYVCIFLRFLHTITSRGLIIFFPVKKTSTQSHPLWRTKAIKLMIKIARFSGLAFRLLHLFVVDDFGFFFLIFSTHLTTIDELMSKFIHK